MSSIISERFILAVNQLIKENKVKSIRQFCQSINYLPQSISQVIHGQRDVTIDVLRNAIEKYNIN
ncbi:MAG TPA: peptidase S24, partial [Saprospiraceae bacterium]|nr:peptidase S24 [Saprospiraceae bacterium]